MVRNHKIARACGGRDKRVRIAHDQFAKRVDTAMEQEGQRHSSYNQHAVSASEGSSDEDGEEMENDLEEAVTNSTFNDRQVQ